MNIKRYVLAFIGVFFTVFIWDFLIHGVLLMQVYEHTQHLWRTQEESNMLFMFLSQVIFSLVFVFIYTKHSRAGDSGESGASFGLRIGLLLSAIELGKYCYMPVPFALVAVWISSQAIKGILAGVVTAKIYGN